MAVCHTPLHIKVKGRLKDVEVGCGKCPVCRQRRVSDWAIRLEHEELASTSSYFVTLTYSSDHVPISENRFMTLDKSDVQKFFKRLRKHDTSKRIKYYAVGEYGSNTWRPHYHIILFNLDDVDSIRKSWKLGTIHVGSVAGASVRYTLKYISKQSRIPVHSRDDRLKEFSLMSKRLGSSYVTDSTIKFHNAMPTDRMYIPRRDGTKVAMPRYYRELIFSQYVRDEQVEHIKRVVKAERDIAETEFYLNDVFGRTYEEHLRSDQERIYASYFKQHKPDKL